jgi:hypothetical protein
MTLVCNRCVRKFLIVTRTWFAFGLPSKTECDKFELQVTQKMENSECKNGIHVI